MPDVRFAGCFDSCQVADLSVLLEDVYEALDDAAPFRKGRWPRRVRCLTTAEIIEGRQRGAGHGKTYVSRGANGRAVVRSTDAIWINPDMSTFGMLLVFIHENLHHAFPDASEKELNNRLVPWVYQRAFGTKLNMRAARLAGLGPPQPGIGDRGYVP